MAKNSTSKPSSKRTRMFSIMTYVGEENIKEVLYNHSSSLRSFAYIYHDKDDTTPHHHLLIRTYDAWSSVQINRWFDPYKLKINENTFTEPAGDLQALEEYLTHGDLKSIQAGKHRYSLDEIVDGGLFADTEKKDSYDETYEIINAMLSGVPTKVLIRRYGKQLIYHYSQFIAVKEAIQQEEYYTYQQTLPEKERMPRGWHITPPNNFEEYDDMQVPLDELLK